MRGELTAKMAEAIAKSKAQKFLLPLTLSKVEVIGVQAEPLPHQVEQLINRLKELAEEMCIRDRYRWAVYQAGH